MADIDEDIIIPYWKFDIGIRVISIIPSIGLVVTAAVALSFITAFDDDATEDGYDYEGASSYQGAAGWLVAIGCAAILLLILTITARILQRKSVVILNERYVLINVVVSALFALSFLAGGIVNAIYTSENVQLNDKMCAAGDFDYYGNRYSSDDYNMVVTFDTCQHLDVVVVTEGAAAGLSFVLFIFFAVLPLIVWASYKYDDKEVSSTVQNNYINTSPQHSDNGFVLYPPSLDASSHKTSLVQANLSPPAEPSSYVPPNVPHHASSPMAMDSGMSYVIPSTPQLVSSHVTPSAPQLTASHVIPTGLSYPPANAPTQVSTSPPPYELALAMARGPKDTSSTETKADITG